MFYPASDLGAVENQIHGFDAALAATDELGEYSRFNSEFQSFLTERTGLSTSQGWSQGLLRQFGQTPEAEAEFLRLVAAFMAQIARS